MCQSGKMTERVALLGEARVDDAPRPAARRAVCCALAVACVGAAALSNRARRAPARAAPAGSGVHCTPARRRYPASPCALPHASVGGGAFGAGGDGGTRGRVRHWRRFAFLMNPDAPLVRLSRAAVGDTKLRAAGTNAAAALEPSDHERPHISSPASKGSPRTCSTSVSRRARVHKLFEACTPCEGPMHR